MAGDPKRSVLSELRKPLMQPTDQVSPELEERLLGSSRQPAPKAPSVETGPSQAPAISPVAQPHGKRRVPTVPVTFHLPIELRDKIKITAQAKQRTMLEIAVEALQEYLDRNKVSEDDLRRLLGL